MQRLRSLLVVAGLATLALVASLTWAPGPSAVVEGAGGGIHGEWEQSGHANRELAVQDATVDFRQASAAHCGRCHASQGFVVWAEQLKQGNPGHITGPDGKAATVEYLASIGLTAESVQPIDCEACHTDTFELRTTDSTPVLPSGFAAKGVGEGALCMSCHNSRNGAIQWDAADAVRYTAPHHSVQADVIMGKNVYFVDYGDAYVSAHAAFTGDSCVTCHMEMGGGHTFQASLDSCANCHGDGYRAEMVQRPVKALLDETAAAISERFVKQFAAKVREIGAWDPETDETRTMAIDGKRIVAVAPTSIHGQMGFEISMQDGKVLYAQLGQIMGADGKPVIPTSDVIVRATWNYLVVLWDGSMGVHNPTFVRTVLTATQEALR